MDKIQQYMAKLALDYDLEHPLGSRQMPGNQALLEDKVRQFVESVINNMKIRGLGQVFHIGMKLEVPASNMEFARDKCRWLQAKFNAVFPGFSPFYEGYNVELDTKKSAAPLPPPQPATHYPLLKEWFRGLLVATPDTPAPPPPALSAIQVDFKNIYIWSPNVSLKADVLGKIMEVCNTYKDQMSLQAKVSEGHQPQLVLPSPKKL